MVFDEMTWRRLNVMILELGFPCSSGRNAKSRVSSAATSAETANLRVTFCALVQLLTNVERLFYILRN